MIKHKTTGLIFKNRKEAKQVMGQGRYKRLLKRQEFEFIADNNQ